MISSNTNPTYLADGVVLIPIEACPWCSSVDIPRIATRGDGIEVSRCQECDLAFTSELPADLSVFYDAGYFERGSVNGDIPAVGYDDYEGSYGPGSFWWLTKLIRVLGPDKQKLFDVGTATGTFLEAAHLEGFDVSGCELQADAALAAQNKGLRVTSGAFDPTRLTPHSYDVVTALEVLEHVRDPRSTLLDIISVLHPDGWFVFFVPVLGDQALVDHGDQILDFQAHFEHTFYFSQRFLQRMGEEMFGEGRFALVVGEAEEQGQTVSWGLGFGRVEPVIGDHERRLIAGVRNGSLNDIEALTDDEAIAIALASAKLGDFSRADAALKYADQSKDPVPDLAVAKAQVLRNKGELLTSISLLEEALASQGVVPDLRALGLFVETLGDLIAIVTTESEGIGDGLRELVQRPAAAVDQAFIQAAIDTTNAIAHRAVATAERARDAAERAATAVSDLSNAMNAVTDELSDTRTQLSAERATVSELKNQNSFLSNALNDIYTSRSWKLIAAIRSARTLPRRLVRRIRPASERAAAELPRDLTRPAIPPVEDYPFLVSVIMPVYNKGATLEESIESVMTQTLSAVEVVLWDDESTDPETMKVLDRVAELPNVTRFRGANQGVVGARNSAIAFSRGRYICCLDPDDLIAPTYLEKAVALLESQPEYAIAYPWVESIGDIEELWETQDLDPGLITRANHVPVCAVFRREVFHETGGFSEEMEHGYEDWEFWAHAAELGFRGKSIPSHLFNYRFSLDAVKSRDAQARESHQELVEEIARLHPRLARTGVPFARPGPGAARRVGSELGPRRIPAGKGRPVVITLPWFTVGGADRVVESLIGKWVSQGRTVVTFVTNRLAPGMTDRRHELDALIPYTYHLVDLLPKNQWYEFVAGVLAALDSPVFLNIGSAWFYEEAETLRRDFPHLRMVDQQFNSIGHLSGNRNVASVIDLTIAAYDRLAEEIASDGRATAVVPVYVGIDDVTSPLPSQTEEFKERAGIRRGERLVLFVGRLAEEKRPDLAIKLASELAEDGARVVIVGDGPLRDDVAEAIRSELGLIWIPKLDTVESAIAAAALLILPSTVEGIPLVAMEALALGTPIVATRVGGLPDLENEEGVTLVDVDDFEAFVEAVRMGLETRPPTVLLPDRFSAAQMLEQYDRLLFATDSSTHRK